MTLVFNLSGRVIRGEYTNHARVAYAWGPFILALDQKLNPEFGGQDAPQFILAAVADVRRLGEFRAHLFPEVRARRVAAAACRATLDAVGLVLTELPLVAR